MNAPVVRFVAEAEAAGERLDVWLARVMGSSRSEVQRLIDAGAVAIVGGHGPSNSLRVREGLQVDVLAGGGSPKGPEAKGFEVRLEDDHLAVVAKPAGLVVHPAPGTRSETLVEALAKRMVLAAAAGEGRPGVVHRLDKGTSGLLIFAKTDEAYHALVQMMRERQIERTYLTLVHGRFRLPSGRIEASVGRAPRRGRMAVTGSGREAATSFVVTEEIGELSLLEVSLHTGRTHQIRVHLSHIGHPVIGDPDYGRRTAVVARALGLFRPFLHAARLRLMHPIERIQIDVAEELPDDLSSALERARSDARSP